MRRAFVALVVVMLLAACGGQEELTVDETPDPTPSPTSTPEEPEPTEEPTPEPTEEPSEPTAALTGLPLEDPAAAERPVVALKIDNAPAARPPQHLRYADIVVEELVEGGTTRFVALYHSIDPGPVGPVRSGREVDADLLPPFSPVLGISGAAPEVQAMLRDAGLLYFEEGQAGNAFFRDSSRFRAPHNLFSNLGDLWAAGTDLTPAERPWPIGDADLDGARPAAEVSMRFPAARNRWTWDGDTGEWLREQDGEPHVDSSGGQMAAANVVVMRAPVRPGNRRDSSGTPTVDIEIIGEGDALVLQDGHAIEARWRKPSREEQIEWLTLEGQPLPLAPGRTWIELLPTDAPLDLMEGTR